MGRTEEILKAISLDTSRAILKQLSKSPMTVRELRKKSLGNKKHLHALVFHREVFKSSDGISFG